MAKLWLERCYSTTTTQETKTGTQTEAENTLTVLKCLFETCTTMTC
jgi:hypothetical protein